MNKVTLIKQRSHYFWTGQIENLIGEHFKDDKSAFIGMCGTGDDDTLYLVTYLGISQASAPGSTWKTKGCSVKVIRFVDVNISVVERKK